jgi:hypothetical protein
VFRDNRYRDRRNRSTNVTVLVKQQLNDGEGQRIPEQATETRLSVAPFLHGGLRITFPEFRKREYNRLDVSRAVDSR